MLIDGGGNTSTSSGTDVGSGPSAGDLCGTIVLDAQDPLLRRHGILPLPGVDERGGGDA